MIIFAHKHTIKQRILNSTTEAHSNPLWIVGERANYSTASNRDSLVTSGNGDYCLLIQYVVGVFILGEDYYDIYCNWPTPSCIRKGSREERVDFSF